MSDLFVTSDVRRDLLQSAAIFNHEKLVIWEYVSNSLQYTARGRAAQVQVDIDPKQDRILIKDNGRGMTLEDLSHFFTMHGENQDRKHGRIGRGRFGTGKSAAFGIADELVVESIRNGLRSCVSLSRADISASMDSTKVPIKVINANEPSDRPDGTCIEIRAITLRRKIDVTGVIRYLQRHMKGFPGAQVYVNRHLVEAKEPAFEYIRTFCAPTSFNHIAGNELVLKVSASPLDDYESGIDVTASGVLHEKSLLGHDSHPYARFVFGSFDVPALEDESIMPPAIDLSRQLRLNRESPVVSEVVKYASACLVSVLDEVKRRREEERGEVEMQALRQKAFDIENLLNRHFREFDRIISLSMSVGGYVGVGPPSQLDEVTESSLGSGFPANVLSSLDSQPPSAGDGRRKGEAPQYLEPDNSGSAPAEGSDVLRKGKRGGFKLEFFHMGSGEPRAKYAPVQKVIQINLDHPQIAIAMADGTNTASFSRTIIEAAVTEYAVAIASDLAAVDHYYEPVDYITEIRQIIDSVMRMCVEYKIYGMGP